MQYNTGLIGGLQGILEKYLKEIIQYDRQKT